MDPVQLLYVTTPDRDVALRLARALVREELAACANAGAALTSVYEWQGQLQEESEVVLLVKTTASKAQAAQERIVEIHPYEVPCILRVPIEGGHGPFLEWVQQQTSR